MKCRERIEEQADHNVAGRERRLEAFPTKPESPAASEKDNPAREDVEVVGLFGSRIKASAAARQRTTMKAMRTCGDI
jgi:hypothetical protein